MIVLEEGEHIDTALRRFKKQCTKDGVFEEMGKRHCFMTPRELKTYKKKYRSVFYLGK